MLIWTTFKYPTRTLVGSRKTYWITEKSMECIQRVTNGPPRRTRWTWCWTNRFEAVSQKWPRRQELFFLKEKWMFYFVRVSQFLVILSLQNFGGSFGELAIFVSNHVELTLFGSSDWASGFGTCPAAEGGEEQPPSVLQLRFVWDQKGGLEKCRSGLIDQCLEVIWGTYSLLVRSAETDTAEVRRLLDEVSAAGGNLT